MSNVLFAARTTATRVLGSLDTAAALTTGAINTLAIAVQVAEQNALRWRDSDALRIKNEAIDDELVAVETAKANVIDKLLVLNQRHKDPEFAALYTQVSARWNA